MGSQSRMRMFPARNFSLRIKLHKVSKMFLQLLIKASGSGTQIILIRACSVYELMLNCRLTIGGGI